MDGFIAIGIAAVVAIPLTVIYLLVSHIRLKGTVRQLNTDLEELAGILAGAQPKTAPEQEPTSEQTEFETSADKTEPSRAAGPWAARSGTGPADSSDTEVPPVQPDFQDSLPPKAVVLKKYEFAKLAAWLRENWFYAVSALSLALAGVFLVQYSVEAGLLPPAARVAAALAMGVLLVGAGEYIRRRVGDGQDQATAYLPATFSGAGVVTLFGAVLSARVLYDLIGPEAAMIGLILVALGSVVLGWFNGPLLAAVGVIGAMAAPFVVGGSSDDSQWLYGYFTVITAIGLAIDAIRRWAWVTLVTLALAFVAGWALLGFDDDVAVAAAVYVSLVAIMAIAIPLMKLTPTHSGTMILGMLGGKSDKPWPEYPTRVAFATMAASAATLVAISLMGALEFWLAIGCLTALVLLMILWCWDAPALDDVAILPAGGLLVATYMHATTFNDAFRAYIAERPPETSMPMEATYLVGIALIISVLAAWRSNQAGSTRPHWAAGAALFAPAMAIVLEISWTPAGVIGDYRWALHAGAIAAVMVIMAERFARADGEDRLRMSFAVLSAIASVAFLCVIVLSSAALTVALAVTVLSAAVLDRRFDLPVMSYYIAVGVVTLGYRLLADPGLGWADRAPVLEILLAYGGTLIALIVARHQIAERDRQLPKVMLESAAWTTGAMLASLLLDRAIATAGGFADRDSHWALSLHAMVWFCTAMAQVYRLQLGGRLRYVRIGLAAVFGIISLAGLVGSLTGANPFFERSDLVIGPPLFNTLVVAYLLPALLFGVVAFKMPNLHPMLRRVLYGAAAGLAAIWASLAIRHFWQGAEGMASSGVTQSELYSYTVALLIVGAAIFYQSLARKSAGMRRAGLIVIGLAVAKVFFIDISGLGSLTRVFSLLALGLSLAGLAWLNRWAQGADPETDPESEAPEPAPVENDDS